MSNFMEKLLDGVAVKYVPVGSIISREREKGRNNSDIKTVYSVSNTQGLVKAEDFRDNTIHSEDTSNYTVVRAGMFAYNPARLNIGSIALLKSDSAGLVSPMYVVFSVDKRIVSTEYLGYFIKSSYCANKIQSLTEEGARFRFDFERWDLIDIPIPSLEVQAKIVRMLDVFCNLTAELTAELTARKKQYNYYRDQLLSFEDGEVEWKTLGDVLQMRAGQHISASKIMPSSSDEYSFPCFGGNGVRGFVENKSHDGEFLLIGRQGALCGNVQRMKGQFYATEHAVVVTVSNEIDIDWAFHMLTVMNLNQYASQSAQPGLAVGNLQGLKIPLPSIGEQKRVAQILDKFDALTHSLTEGLPREIALRQKQYAYYRDLLLSFPKPEAPTVAQA